MKLAIMQPYFFPYIGYFNLLNACDEFIFFDDVNFIKKGWINRNNILNGDAPLSFSIPLAKISQNKRINETELFEYGKWRDSFVKQLWQSYSKAPQYKEVEKMITSMLTSKMFTLISDLAAASIIHTADYLDLSKRFKFSSQVPYSGSTGQEKILSICKANLCSMYINPKNGTHLYDAEAFRKEGIELKFIEALKHEYAQFGTNEFTPWLSMIDVLMFNTKSEARNLLTKYHLN